MEALHTQKKDTIFIENDILIMIRKRTNLLTRIFFARIRVD